MDKIIFIHGLLGSKHNFEFLTKEFSAYDTVAIDLIGFGEESKPGIKYDINDFVDSLECKLKLKEEADGRLILVGHSMGALLAKELVIKYPDRISRAFLISYPFHDGEEVLHRYGYFDRKYAEGAWWTKILCQTEFLYQWIFYPYFYLFRYKHRRSYMDFFKHTYHSAHSAIKNTILMDNREKLSSIADKLVLIGGENDHAVDFAFSRQFNNYVIQGMGHIFFGYEKEIAGVIKENL